PAVFNETPTTQIYTIPQASAASEVYKRQAEQKARLRNEHERRGRHFAVPDLSLIHISEPKSHTLNSRIAG
ncbi:hypothetical protein, partial [Caballeronia sp. INML3B]|uniref:hypothetical protein n=1 Tax=Caballeronia sp. INML3B TaxID=2921749 RepID=UPI002028C101